MAPVTATLLMQMTPEVCVCVFLCVSRCVCVCAHADLFGGLHLCTL